MTTPTLEAAYAAIATSLQEFGYPDATAEMVKDAHNAMKNGEDMPHGVIGMFAQGMIEDHDDLFKMLS